MIRIITTKRLKALEKKLSDTEFKLRGTTIKLNNAKQEAFKDYMAKSGLLNDAVKEMSFGLGKLLGKELKPHAERLLKARQNMGNELIDFDIKDDFERFAETISGSIPEIRFQISLA